VLPIEFYNTKVDLDSGHALHVRMSYCSGTPFICLRDVQFPNADMGATGGLDVWM
jgi:hypothetical protein